MATINFKVIKKQIAKQAGSKIAKISDKILVNRYEKAREEFLIELGEDPISQELTAGPNAANLSGTLNREGNLFSFFGFPIGADPVRKLLEYLDKKIIRGPSRILMGGRITSGKKIMTIRSRVDMPSLKELESSSIGYITDDYPNQGWIKGVRQGQGGYGKYIFEVVRRLAKSRSTTGLQIKGTVQMSSMYPKTNYISSQIENFKKKLFKK